MYTPLLTTCTFHVCSSLTLHPGHLYHELFYSKNPIVQCEKRPPKFNNSPLEKWWLDWVSVTFQGRTVKLWEMLIFPDDGSENDENSSGNLLRTLGFKQNSEPIWHPRTMLWFTSLLKDESSIILNVFSIAMYTTKSSSWVQINFTHFNMEVKTCQVNPVLENAKMCWFLTFSDFPKDLENWPPTNLWLQHVETNKSGSMKHH